MSCVLTFLIFLLAIMPAWAGSVAIGPVYTDRDGDIGVLIEVPLGVTPKTVDYQLHFDRQVVSAATKKIQPFNGSNKAMALVVCVDISGSIGKKMLPEIKGALAFLTGMARTNRQQDKIGLVTFGDTVTVAAPLSQPLTNLPDVALQIKTEGVTTRLYQALNKSLELLSDPTLPKRRRIIVISDGKDEGSVATLKDVTTKAKAMRIPIDALGYGRIDRAFKEVLSAIAEVTGGQFIEAVPGKIRLNNGLERLYDGLYQQQSWIVNFSYDTAEQQSVTDQAAIAINQPDGTVEFHTIPGEYPFPKKNFSKSPSRQESALPLAAIEGQSPSSQQETTSRLSIGTIFGVLALLAFVVVFLFIRRSTIKEEPTERKEIVRPTEVEAAPETIVDFQPKRATVVGGHVYSPPSPGAPCALIIGVDGPASGIRLDMEKVIALIGRAEENDFAIVGDERVSRAHASLRFDQGSLFVFDSGSLNGTLVNGTSLRDIGVPLEPGDRIQCGESTLEVQLPPTEKKCRQNTVN